MKDELVLFIFVISLLNIYLNDYVYSTSEAVKQKAANPVIDTLKLIVEIISLLLCNTYYVFYAIYKSIAPTEEESVAGEIVLVSKSNMVLLLPFYCYI